jgi:hypothetical protein
MSCPFSNAVIAGLRNMASVTHGYDGLRQQHGVQVIHAHARGIDPTARRVTLDDGSALGYDRLVLSPGIDLRWGAIEGYDVPASEVFPHAWEAGPQTLLLSRQLDAMPDGGLVLIAAPAEPYRCPPGPYERASLIAHYLKTRKPRSKLLILDAKNAFSKQELFRNAWAHLYPGLLEWIPQSQSGRVIRVDTDARTVSTDFDDYKPAVANIIPPQQAATIATPLASTMARAGAPCAPAPSNRRYTPEFISSVTPPSSTPCRNQPLVPITRPRLALRRSWQCCAAMHSRRRR